MPSSRRLKFIVVTAFIGLILVLFYSSTSSKSSSTLPVSRNRGSSSNKQAQDKEDAYDAAAAAGVSNRLKQAEQAAKIKANQKAPDQAAHAQAIVDGEAGKHVKADHVAHGHGDGSAAGQDGNSPVAAAPKAKEGGQYDAMEEIDGILKRSPVIIFSKTYCGFSRRAKALLLERYKIVPDPFVVELDEHPHGQEIQDALLKQTGRRTVPNILIQGQTIGGADDLAELEAKGELVTRIKKLGGKNVMSMERRE